jgi:hypothetical protein
MLAALIINFPSRLFIEKNTLHARFFATVANPGSAIYNLD